MRKTEEFSFGLHMICKDEAHIIGRILANVGKTFDQIVVVDTGSTDGTVEYIKKEFPTVEVHEFKWTNSFSDARNFALSKLNTTTAMWLDADDTFDPASAKKWRSMARHIFNKKKHTYILLPYHYAVGAHDVPLLLQHRERIIKNPWDWEWRNDIHEILCYKGERHPTPMVVEEMYPVIHRPHKIAGDYLRNWRILHKNRLKGEDDIRTLYYIQREALDKGQEEYSIICGNELMSKNPEGYYRYEGYKHLGDAYMRLYQRDNLDEYLKLAEQNLLEAIKYEPNRNEARDALIGVYLESNRVFKALEHANALLETPVPNIATQCMDKYYSYKHAVLTKIHLSYMNHISSAVNSHLQSLDFPSVADQCLQNDLLIRQHLDNFNVGVIYSDDKYLDIAQLIKTRLIGNGIFHDVIISNNPLVMGLARYWYFHLTDDEDTYYVEDTKPDVIKFLLSNKIKDVPIHFYSRYDMPSCIEGVKVILEDVMGQVDTFGFADIETFLICSKQSYKPIQLGLFTDKLFASDVLTDILIGDDGIHNIIRFLVNKDMELLAIAASTDAVNSLAVSGDTIFVSPTMNIDIVSSDTYNLAHFTGIPFHIKSTPRNKGKVAFYAGGMEPWDGRTPYKTGIGASETSLIYVAEELVLAGYDVAVYNNVPNPTVISGVNYLPASFFNNRPKDIDLLIGSRCPSLFEHDRHCKKQVLWMHDLPEVYRDLTPNHKIDQFICVSDWARKRFYEVHPSIPAWKVVTVPNAINKTKRDTTIKREPGRMVWLSSPDRGVLDLVDTWIYSDPKKEKLKDLFIFYGFHNLRVGYLHDVNVFKDICRSKFIFRSSGAKLLGRVPIQNVKHFLQTVDMLPYTSTFGETYCVSVVEALHAGVHCIINNNGATLETAIDTSTEHKDNDLITVPTFPGVYEQGFQKYWKTALMSDFDFKDRDTSSVSDEHTWEYITKTCWIPMIGSGN